MSFSGWSKAHLAQLEAWHIDRETAKRRGYRALDADGTYERIKQRFPTIQMPCIGPDGLPRKNHRYRRVFKPGESVSGHKYTQAANTSILIHHRKPPKPSKKLAGRVVITEGEANADALSEALDVYVISLPGVGAYKDKDTGELHSDLAALKAVEICFDTDAKVNPEIGYHLFDLADRLVAAGAQVTVRDLNPLPNLEKTGADDLVHHGGADAYLNSPLHDLDSPAMQKWRKHAARRTDTLPASLRNLKPRKGWYYRKPTPPTPLVEWILNNDESALWNGSAGTSKTMFGLELAVCVATGRDFFGLKVPTAVPVMYLTLERSARSAHERWHKVAHKHGRTITDKGDKKAFVKRLEENTYVEALAGETLRFVEFKNNEWVISDTVRDLIRTIREHGIKLVVTDPVARMHGGNENDAALAATLTKAVELIMRECECAFAMTHHTGKELRGDMYSGRGSSAFNDNTSQCLVFSVMDDAEKGNYDLSFAELKLGEENQDFVRVHHARCADGPRRKDDLILRRDDLAVLHLVRTKLKDAATLLDDQLTKNEKFMRWADACEKFSQTKFIKERDEFFVGPRGATLSERKAKELFLKAQEARVLIPALDDDGKPAKSTGGQLFRLNPEQRSAARAARSAAALSSAAGAV